MLDPLNGLGLAGNVVQLVDFGFRLFAKVNEVYFSTKGVTIANAELESLVEDFRYISGTLVQNPKAGDSTQNLALKTLVVSCRRTADELLTILQSLSVQKPHKIWESTRKAVQGVAKEKQIRELETRLNSLRREVHTHLLALLTNRQSEVRQNLELLSQQHEEMDIRSNDRINTMRNDIIECIQSSSSARVGPGELFRNELLPAIAIAISKLKDTSENLRKEQMILNSLRFRMMDVRLSNIVEAHTNTFQWILKEHSSPHYMEWLRLEGGIYWITGKPGSGKSTLMKFLRGNERVREELLKWAGESKLVVAHFFFWNAGTELQKSQQGLLQGLLYEIYRQSPEIIPSVIPGRWRAATLDDHAELWTHAEVSQVLRLSIQYSTSTRFCFFVDGLDEYQGEPAEVIKFMESIASSSRVKICLSSRPWNSFEVAFGSESNRHLMLQDFTKHDIRQYVTDEIENDSSFKQLRELDHRYQNLVEQTVNKAQGVFLWVFLVVRSLRRGLPNYDTVEWLEKRLTEFPPDLDNYFDHMLKSIEPIYRQQSAQMLQLCLNAEEPLPALTFSFLDEKPGYAVRANYRAYEDYQMERKTQNMRKRIKARCLDLVEVCQDMGRFSYSIAIYQVDFLHRTVRDFLKQPRLQRLIDGWVGPSFDVDLYLCEAFLAQFKMAAVTIHGVRDPFWQAHCMRFLLYAKRIERSTGSPPTEMLSDADKILSRFPMDAVRKRFKLPKEMDSFDSSSGVILPLALQHGLLVYVSQELGTNSNLARNMNGQHPLRIILPRLLEFDDDTFAQNLAILKVLLEHRAGPNEREGGTTPWSDFLRRVRDAPHVDSTKCTRIMESFLRHGADHGVLGFAATVRLKLEPADARRVMEIIEESRTPSLFESFTGWLRNT